MYVHTVRIKPSTSIIIGSSRLTRAFGYNSEYQRHWIKPNLYRTVTMLKHSLNKSHLTGVNVLQITASFHVCDWWNTRGKKTEKWRHTITYHYLHIVLITWPTNDIVNRCNVIFAQLYAVDNVYYRAKNAAKITSWRSRVSIRHVIWP